MTPLVREQFWLLRVTRRGPLVPARLRWLDHAPLDPIDNKLDRGRLSIFPAVDIAGQDRPPEELFQRFAWGGVLQPMHAIPSPDDVLEPMMGPDHWKFPQPITKGDFDRRFRHVEAHVAVGINPRKRLDPSQLPLPNFDRENGR